MIMLIMVSCERLNTQAHSWLHVMGHLTQHGDVKMLKILRTL